MLTQLAGELVREVHPYFLPCEGVFHSKKQEAKGEPSSVRASILLLRDDNWTRFASDAGPVPDPRDTRSPTRSRPTCWRRAASVPTSPAFWTARRR